MITMKYITSAREAVATYNAIGSEAVIELRDILVVLIGPSSTPELTGRLAGRGIRALVEMTVCELEEVGMTHNEALKFHSGMLQAKSYVMLERLRNDIQSDHQKMQQLI